MALAGPLGRVILMAFPMTVRPLANMAKTAIKGSSHPATARGIPTGKSLHVQLLATIIKKLGMGFQFFLDFYPFLIFVCFWPRGSEKMKKSFFSGETVKATSLQNEAGISRLKLFLALSRTPHGILDLAAPSMSALLWLGGFPPVEVLALGLITAFSGYTAVYALNDVVDRRVDKGKVQETMLAKAQGDLDSVFVRHPLAQGMLSPREGFLWTLAWAVLAMVGTYLLNPICTIIFSLACLLEYSYCRLLKVSYFRVVISGLVKTSGPLAAVFAVDSNPDLGFLATLFAWLFFWEMGGQNVPNDFSDMEEDRKIGAKTIPVKFGAPGSTLIILVSLVLAFGISLVLIWIGPKALNLAYLFGALLSGLYFLLIPGYRLWQSKNPRDALVLFNRASYYPLAILLTTVMSWFFPGNL